jgi:hypothetical protein
MDRPFGIRKKDLPLHRWLGLRPVDFVRAAERRAAVLLRQLGEQRRKQRQGTKRHYPLHPIPCPLSRP